jgi:hypothetical protein
MKILKSSLIILLGLALLSSCGTVNHVNGKLIVGSWKFDKVMAYIPSSSEAAESLYKPSAAGEQTKSGSSTSISEALEIKKMIKESMINNDPSVLVTRFPEMITAIEFKADKTAHVTSRKTSIKGIWKINKTGTKIKITASDTKKITQIEIRDVGFTSLEIVDPLSEGNFILLFKK